MQFSKSFVYSFGKSKKDELYSDVSTCSPGPGNYNFSQELKRNTSGIK